MDFILTLQDKTNITTALTAGGDIWENPILFDFKKRVKNHYQTKQLDQCCYCRKNIHNEFKMVLDIEHVLPKSKFGEFMFEVFNLSVSCKRCNMKVKRDNVTFITDIAAIRVTPKNNDLYKILHPHLDDYFKHLKLATVQIDQIIFIKYYVVDSSEKGQFTYEFFHLKDLEIERLDIAQGGKQSSQLSETINIETSKKILELIDQLGK